MEILHIFFSVSIFYNFLNNISLNNLFILDCAGFGCCLGCSLTVASGDYSQLSCLGFSVWWLLLLQSIGFRCAGFGSCSTQAEYLWFTGSVALRHGIFVGQGANLCSLYRQAESQPLGRRGVGSVILGVPLFLSGHPSQTPTALPTFHSLRSQLRMS